MRQWIEFWIADVNQEDDTSAPHQSSSLNDTPNVTTNDTIQSVFFEEQDTFVHTYRIAISLCALRDSADSSFTRTFHGGCLDIGAQRSVIGLPQAQAYCRKIGISFDMVPSNNSFRFGVGTAKSMGKIPIVISTPQNALTLWVDVITDNIPFLIGLDTLDKYSLQVLSVHNQLECVREGWKVPLERKFGHIYWDWNSNFCTYFSRPQLERLHRHLLHPSTRKLYNLLTRAKPEQMTKHTMETLQAIKETCETCQLYAPRQFVFRIRDTEAIRFNHQILRDIMYLDRDPPGKRGTKTRSFPVLHVVDAGTKFQNAAFLTKLDANSIWNTFVKMWASIYVGFPETMLTDQGSVFVSREWKYNCEVAQIELKHTGTESHNSLGAGETYHAILRVVYQKTRRDHPTVTCDVTLALTVKAINSTVGPHGLCL